MTINPPNPSVWPNNQAENAIRNCVWGRFRVISFESGDSFHLSVDDGHTDLLGMSRAPRAVEAADGRQAIGGAAEQHLPRKLGAASVLALAQPANGLQPAEDLLDALAHPGGGR